MLFLDTTILVGAADARDECHEDGKAVLQAIATGKPGLAFTSEYVLDEVITILSSKRGVGAAKAVAFVRHITSSPRVRVLPVESDDFAQTLADYARNGPLGLSFTDATSLLLMASQGCQLICSHDAGFDRVKGITRRRSLT